MQISLAECSAGWTGCFHRLSLLVTQRFDMVSFFLAPPLRCSFSQSGNIVFNLYISTNNMRGILENSFQQLRSQSKQLPHHTYAGPFNPPGSSLLLFYDRKKELREYSSRLLYTGCHPSENNGDALSAALKSTLWSHSLFSSLAAQECAAITYSQCFPRQNQSC